MATKNRLKTYQVTARLALMVSTEISAESLEDAAIQAKTMKEADFVEVLGEFQDGNIFIQGVSDNEQWSTD